MKKVAALLLVTILLFTSCTNPKDTQNLQDPPKFEKTNIYSLTNFTEKNSFSDEGEFRVSIPKESVAAVGVIGAPMLFSFIDHEKGGYTDYFLTTGVFPLTNETKAFQENMPSMGKAFERYARKTFEKTLKEFAYENATVNGVDVYLINLMLEEDGTTMYVSASYTFRKSYYLFAMGVWYDPQDSIVKDYTLYTAASFKDYTETRLSANPSMFYSNEYTAELPPWEYPITNGIGSIKEHSQYYFKDGLSAKEKWGDEEIVWKTSYMENIARSLTEITDRPLMQSDLELYDDMRFVGGNGGKPIYSLQINNFSFEFETDDFITSLEDLEHFKNLNSLYLEMHKVNDISALANLPNLTTAMFTLDGEIDDLSPLGEITSLKEISMWGQDYPNVTDISFFSNLQNLEYVMMLLPSIDDINVFAELPHLKTLGLHVAKNYDDTLMDYSKFDTANINAIDKLDPSVKEEDDDTITTSPETPFDFQVAALHEETLNLNTLKKEDGYYLIASLDDFVYMQKAVNQRLAYSDGTKANTANYKLTADIDFSSYTEEWLPIGSGEWLGGGNRVSFAGEFDGQNHAIENFTLQEVEGRNFSGLFGFIDKGVLKNIRLTNCDVEGYESWTGGLAGGIWNTWGHDYAEILNCHVSGKVRGGETVGGVAYNAILIENSSFEGTISSNDPEAHIGGVALDAHRIYGCYANLNVEDGSAIGGIVVESNYIENCYSTGNISSPHGVVAGIAVESSSLVSCYTTANLSGETVAGITVDNRELYNQLDGDVSAVLKGTLVASNYLTAGDGWGSFTVVSSPLSSKGDNFMLDIIESTNIAEDFSVSLSPSELKTEKHWKTILNQDGKSWDERWVFSEGEYPKLHWQVNEYVM